MIFRALLVRLLPVLGLLALSACSWLGGGSPSVLVLDGEMHFVRALDVGQTLVLDVRNPGSGGYQFAGTAFDPSILRLELNTLTPPEQIRAGDFGRARFEFLALAPGRTDVVIKIHRPFEKDVPPEAYKVVEVRVGGQANATAPPAPANSSLPKSSPAQPAPAGSDASKADSPQPREGEAAKKGGWFSWIPWF